MTLPVYKLEHYIIQIAAENEIGTGPFSQPLNVEFDPIILIAESDLKTDGKKERTLQVLVIGVVSAAIFIIILISAVICYKKKLNQNKPSGYLAASTAEDFHCQLNSRPIIKNQDYVDKRASKDTSLWIDRRWGGNNDSCEKDSNSSEKKLLHAQHNHTHSNSNSDTEYAYVENKHNLSSFTNSSGSRKAAESPEPYATTDIFQRHNSKPNHYAAPIIRPNYVRRNVHSCDDLTDAEPRSQNPYLVPHNYQRASNTGGKLRNSKVGKPKNLLDMIPPPPLHPPPPPTTSNSIYNKSQESVISPKYLFAHPMYQQNHYRVQPVNRSHYEQVDNHVQPRLVFDRDCHDELQHFNAMLTQFNTPPASILKSTSDHYRHCEADNEADEGSSLASHKSNDNYA